MTEHELKLKAVALRRAAFVASAILADGEPGFQPGGKNRRVSEVVRRARARWQIVRLSGRQDVARYGRQGCPPLRPRRALLRFGFALVLSVLSLVLACSATADQPKPAFRPRVIISTDFPPFPVTNSDPDDVQSLVRFLLYANEFDIEGLIASAGTYGMVAEKKNILAVLAEYDKVDENLRKHDPKYPTADALRAVTFEGRGNNHGISIKWGCGKQPHTEIIGKGKDSEASNAIIAAADKPDSRPIYIGVWGGPREVAQAIWKVKHTRSEAELKAFIGKLRIFLIGCQDATHEWLMNEFPDLFIIESKKTYQGMFGSDNRAWVEENIINNHGPLGAIYPPAAIAGPGVIEGDSPAFLYLVSANRGINNPEDPTQPSWGGQYVRKPGTNHYVDGPGGATIAKWKNSFQAEFKQRADWMLP